MDMQQTRNYLLIFGFQAIIIIVGPMVNIGTDTFITGLIIHACGEFRVLKMSLQLLKQRALQLQQQENSCRSERDLMSAFIYFVSLSQWPRGLRRRSAVARLLGLWVRIPPGAWMFVCCECFVLSGRGLCDELITRPEESYRMWCVVVYDLENLMNEEPYPIN